MTNNFKIFLFNSFQRVWSKWYPKHIEVALEGNHVQHCKVLADRLDMLDLLPQNAVIAELGVEEGLFSKEILARCFPTQFMLVDTWPDARIKATCVTNAMIPEKTVMHQTTSVEYLKSLTENSLDWVYIDTDHTYATTKAELEAAAIAVNGSIIELLSSSTTRFHHHANGLYVLINSTHSYGLLLHYLL